MIALAKRKIKMNFSSSNLPRLYPETYRDKVGDFLLVYNPISSKGITVLNKEAAFLFSLIDGKKTLGEIYEIATVATLPRNDADFTFKDLQRIFNDFYEADLIHFGDGRFPELNAQKFRESLAVPSELGVWLHLTNQCNLRCKYCYVSKNEQKMSEETAQKALKKIIKNTVDNNFKKITIKFSGGEALLELDRLVKLVKYAREIASSPPIRRVSRNDGIKIDFVVLTNGTLITEKVAKILKENNIRASVSLDGLGKYHDRNRIFANGSGSFKLVEKGIENLQKSKVPFNVSVTVAAQNLENVPALTKYLLEKKIPFVFNFYRENSLVKEDLENDDQKMIKYLKEAYKIIGENLPKYSLINGLLDRVSFKRPHLRACGVGRNYLIVGHKGTLHCCQMTLDKSIGSINDSDLIKTMQKGDFTKGITVENKTPCKACQWKYLCCGGCPLLTFSQKGRYDVSTPYCQVYKALIPELLRLEAKRLIKYGMV